MNEADPSTHILPSTFNLLQAPIDIQRSVLLALDTRELVLCTRVRRAIIILQSPKLIPSDSDTQVCRTLASLTKNDIAIRYKLELALSGKIDGTRSIAIVDRLTALREHRVRFRAGDYPLNRASRSPVGFLPTRSGMTVVRDNIPLWRPAAPSIGIEELKISHSVQRLGLDGHQTGSCVVDLAQDLLIFSRKVTNFDPLYVQILATSSTRIVSNSR